MEECVDGEYQNFKAEDGAYVREHFFGKYPELEKIIENMTDDDIWRLNRGGNDKATARMAFAHLARIVHGCTSAAKHMDVRERPRQDKSRVRQ